MLVDFEQRCRTLSFGEMLTILLIVIALIALARFIIPAQFFTFSKVRTVSGKRVKDVISVVPGNFIFGNTYDFSVLKIDTVFKYFRDLNAKYKGTYLLYGFHVPIYCATTPEDAELVLSNPTIITKSLIYQMLNCFLGTGLLTSAGSKWHFRRKLLTPAFHFNILQQFLEIFKEESEKFMNKIDKLTEKSEEVCLDEIIPPFTLNNVCETALGVKLDDMSEGDIYRSNIHKIEDFIMKRLFNLWMYADLFYAIFGSIFGKKRSFSQYLKQVHQFSSQIIETRRNDFKNSIFLNNNYAMENGHSYKKKKRFAMLDTLLAAEYEGQNIDHRGICEEVDTFMFEGYDTTSMSIMFTLLLLGIHQDVQNNVFLEIESLTNDVYSLDSSIINAMKYLDCVVKESLRLFPSVPLIGRQTSERTVLGDLILPKNAQILIHIFDINRDPRHFPDPDTFDPDRFLPENTEKRHPFSYIPFSAGQRNCIGQRFALLEIKVLLIDILLHYHIQPVTKLEDIVFEGGLLLRSKYPIKVKFVKRDIQK